MQWIGFRLRDRFRENAANSKVMDGVRTFLKMPDDDAAMRLRGWTWLDSWRERRTASQLSAPNEERFPFLRQALPLDCLCRVGPCPALIHPKTGTLFGIRVGTHLSLLRLPESSRQKAIDAGAAWLACPLPALRSVNLAEHFGPEWVVPITLHPEIGEYYLAAYDFATERIQ